MESVFEPGDYVYDTQTREYCIIISRHPYWRSMLWVEYPNGNQEFVDESVLDFALSKSRSEWEGK